MGLDIILALLILAAAVRGWFRGFVLQAIRFAGLVGSVYAAAPIRDQARPYVAPYLPSMGAELLDRLLWWTAAVVTYVVSVGLATLAVKMARRRPYGEVEPNRTDQFAGLLLGAAKGAVVVAFVASGLHRHAVARVKGIDWAESQAKDSYALMWEGQYHPAERVWASPPVRHFVGHVKRMGFLPGEEVKPASAAPESPEAPIQAASADAPPKLELDGHPSLSLDPHSPDFLRDFDRAWDGLDSAERPQD